MKKLLFWGNRRFKINADVSLRKYFFGITFCIHVTINILFPCSLFCESSTIPILSIYVVSILMMNCSVQAMIAYCSILFYTIYVT